MNNNDVEDYIFSTVFGYLDVLGPVIVWCFQFRRYRTAIVSVPLGQHLVSDFHFGRRGL